MNAWRKYPVTSEIDSGVWGELSQKCQRRVNLATAPVEQWDATSCPGIVWA
jgi:hypothetical protein